MAIWSALVLLGSWGRLCRRMAQPWWAGGPGGCRLAGRCALGLLVLLGSWGRLCRSMPQPWWAGGLLLPRCFPQPIKWQLVRWVGTAGLSWLS